MWSLVVSVVHVQWAGGMYAAPTTDHPTPPEHGDTIRELAYAEGVLRGQHGSGRDGVGHGVPAFRWVPTVRAIPLTVIRM